MEDSLRTMFANQVKEAPALDDPATSAIRRSRRTWRRRHVSAGLASMLTLAVLAGGLVSIRDWWQEPVGTGVTSPIVPPPEPTAHDPEPWDGAGLVLEIRLVNRVWTADGERLLLSGSQLVEQAYRTPHGLVFGNEREIRLRLDDGSVIDIADEAGQWQVSPDGQRIAMVAGGRAQLAPLDADGLGVPARVTVPEGTAPVAFWGERVVLAGPDGSGYDLWDPAAAYEPAWNDELVAVYGQAGDDLVVLVGEPGAYCVALVPAEADGLQPHAPGDCDEPLPAFDGEHGWLSPDGKWLALPGEDEVLLVDVTEPGGDDTSVVTCPRRERVEPVWLDSTTLVTGDASGALSCDVNGATERLGLPERLGTLWEFVPALGTGG